MKLLAAVLVAAAASVATAKCPNSCNGHGTCGVDDVCSCFQGFQGADCSQRACPEAEAWAVDSASPHTHAECANRGTCNRQDGTCECFAGFEGEACQRASCQSGCSGHGRCLMLQDLPNYVASGSSASWDEVALMGCVCDGGWFGPDCSMRSCPYGDDPSTVCDQTQSVEQVQEVTFKLDLNFDAAQATTNINSVVGIVGNEFSLAFTTPNGVTFNTSSIIGAWGDSTSVSGTVLTTTSQAAADPITGGNRDSNAESRIELALESLPNYAIRDVTVQHYKRTISGTQYTNSYRITFHHLQNGQNSYGAQNLLACNLPTVCAGPGCQPRVRQPYAAAIFEGGNTGAMSQVAIASLDTLEASVASTAGTWVKFHSDSTLQCPSTATNCLRAGNSKLTGGINIVFDSGKVWVRAFGSGDVEGVILHNDAGASGQLSTVTAGTWAYRPSTTLRDDSTKNYKFMGTLVAANKDKFDITDVIPNTYLQFHSIPGSTSVATIFFEPATCTVTDVTQAGSPLSNPDVENIECSGRGECDRGSGQCECYEGYVGHNCGKVTTVV